MTLKTNSPTKSRPLTVPGTSPWRTGCTAPAPPRSYSSTRNGSRSTENSSGPRPQEVLPKVVSPGLFFSWNPTVRVPEKRSQDLLVPQPHFCVRLGLVGTKMVLRAEQACVQGTFQYLGVQRGEEVELVLERGADSLHVTLAPHAQLSRESSDKVLKL